MKNLLPEKPTEWIALLSIIFTTTAIVQDRY